MKHRPKAILGVLAGHGGALLAIFILGTYLHSAKYTLPWYAFWYALLLALCLGPLIIANSKVPGFVPKTQWGTIILTYARACLLGLLCVLVRSRAQLHAYWWLGGLFPAAAMTRVLLGLFFQERGSQTP